jgi:hypothetical protein
MRNLWNTDISILALPGPGRTRKIGRAPLIDLGALQASIAGGQLTVEGVWPATRRSRNCLEDYGWTYDDVLQIFSCLCAEDYKESEWCEIDGGRIVPSDVYTIRYDEARRQRNASGLEIYLKFSVDGDGALTLILVQNHF